MNKLKLFIDGDLAFTGNLNGPITTNSCVIKAEDRKEDQVFAVTISGLKSKKETGYFDINLHSIGYKTFIFKGKDEIMGLECLDYLNTMNKEVDYDIYIFTTESFKGYFIVGKDDCRETNKMPIEQELLEYFCSVIDKERE